MRAWVVLGIVSITSLAAGWLGISRLGFPTKELYGAVAGMLELVGASAAFFVLNLTIGVVAVMAIRGMTTRFISVYVLDDVSLLVLSVVQGLLFASWSDRRRGRLLAE